MAYGSVIPFWDDKGEDGRTMKWNGGFVLFQSSGPRKRGPNGFGRMHTQFLENLWQAHSPIPGDLTCLNSLIQMDQTTKVTPKTTMVYASPKPLPNHRHRSCLPGNH